jgi:predicted nucleic acid-binding protein
MLTLDSNILILYLNGDENTVNQLLAWRDKGEAFLVSVITELEVLSLPNINFTELDKIQKFLREFTIVPLDSQLARIAAGFRRTHKTGLGDSVVAATAHLTNSILVTQDMELIRKIGSSVRTRTISR